MRPDVFVKRGLSLLQEAVLIALQNAGGGPMSTSDIADALGMPHTAAERDDHLAKQLLFHMEREGLVEDVRPTKDIGHEWVSAL